MPLQVSMESDQKSSVATDPVKIYETGSRRIAPDEQYTHKDQTHPIATISKQNFSSDIFIQRRAFTVPQTLVVKDIRL